MDVKQNAQRIGDGPAHPSPVDLHGIDRLPVLSLDQRHRDTTSEGIRVIKPPADDDDLDLPSFLK